MAFAIARLTLRVPAHGQFPHLPVGRRNTFRIFYPFWWLTIWVGNLVRENLIRINLAP